MKTFKTLFFTGLFSDLPPSSSTCSPTVITDYISYAGCQSEEKVPVTQCEGHCDTASVYVSQ